MVTGRLYSSDFESPDLLRGGVKLTDTGTCCSSGGWLANRLGDRRKASLLGLHEPLENHDRNARLSEFPQQGEKFARRQFAVDTGSGHEVADTVVPFE
jgi:hypothetical protein